ncbi:unnamed protein product, partial [Heligmosomoides polygyrus]|uniref:C-type lectin domain-containing protein n=1 Tax=Heligmosomoides polygyrus TaxID=6339 RepID=A0A183F7C5_HELPZ
PIESCLFIQQSACPCSGVVVQSNDQPHCWEVLPRPASTWIDADVTCESVGGHLGHPNGTESKEIFSYVQKVACMLLKADCFPELHKTTGSAQAGIYALLCPGNSIYGLLPNDTTFVKVCRSLPSAKEKTILRMLSLISIYVTRSTKTQHMLRWEVSGGCHVYQESKFFLRVPYMPIMLSFVSESVMWGFPLFRSRLSVWKQQNTVLSTGWPRKTSDGE